MVVMDIYRFVSQFCPVIEIRWSKLKKNNDNNNNKEKEKMKNCENELFTILTTFPLSDFGPILGNPRFHGKMNLIQNPS